MPGPLYRGSLLSAEANKKKSAKVEEGKAAFKEDILWLGTQGLGNVGSPRVYM